MVKRLQLRIRGIVQGVGFRPFIYNLAGSLKLKGFVLNDTSGVTIEIQGSGASLKQFLKCLRLNIPDAAYIKSIEKKQIPFKKNEKTFLIKKSRQQQEKFVFIAYDLSICKKCLKELFDKKNRRFLYPFINCTNCGPRYTIIKNIPYDRKKTTMRNFKMCTECSQEYNNPADRRFHAQPDACFSCGPSIKLSDKRITTKISALNRKETRATLKKSTELLVGGKILAVKGIGGYHLACDATNIDAVRLLRKKKNRPSKPFALMAADIKTIKNICFVSKKEEKLLLSPKRPIVLLKIKKKSAWMEQTAPNQKFLGIMIAYAPLHYLLFDCLKKLKKNPVLVMTSANLKDFPLARNEKEIYKLKKLVDCFLTHNRPIHVGCDDSISRIYNNKEYLLRKARGYAPDFFEFPLKKRILGCGAELKSNFSITKNNYLITSQYLGDLKNYPNYRFYQQTLAHFNNIFSFNPQIIAHDYHPGYLSSQYALSLKNIPTIPVQHHHAHAAACMVENRLKEKVIGVIFDGIGFGTDKKIWGGEFLICDLKNFRRAAHFDYFGLLGGDKAIEEPYRTAFFMLYAIFKREINNINLEFLRQIPASVRNAFSSLIRNKKFLQCSSVGRLFDAVAALLGIKDKITYEAEAAILLEMIAYDYKGKKSGYPFKFYGKNPIRILWQPIFKEIVSDMIKKQSLSSIAWKFHYTLSDITVQMCKVLRKANKINKVVLSGGVFQNWLLLTLTCRLLRENKFQVYTHSRFPCNDACISVGQVAVASEKNR